MRLQKPDTMKNAKYQPMIREYDRPPADQIRGILGEG